MKSADTARRVPTKCTEHLASCAQLEQPFRGNGCEIVLFLPDAFPNKKRTRRTVSFLHIEPRKTKKRPKAYASEHLNLVTRTGIEPMIPP
jgi:hypothetical protein